MSQGQKKVIAAALTRATSAFSLSPYLTLPKLIALLLPLLLHRWGKLRLRNDFKPCVSNPDGPITDAPTPLAFVVTCGAHGQIHCDNKKEILPLEGPGQPETWGESVLLRGAEVCDAGSMPQAALGHSAGCGTPL